MVGEEIEAQLRVIAVLGMPTTYRGWSLRTRKPKLPVSTLKEGSLVICEVENPGRWVNLLPIIGLDSYASMGFNQLLPLTRDPFYRGGES